MTRAHIALASEWPERRGAERRAIELCAQLRELGFPGSGARVLNLSTTGFMAETEADLDVGARIWLVLPGRWRASAVVRWVRRGRIGARFEQPVEPDLLDPR